jgi:putative Holliday junction resolvase
VDPTTLIGQAVATFDLGVSATGTVVAVDPSPVRSIAEARLRGRIGTDHRLVDGSIQVDVGKGSVGEDGQVTFEATARAAEVTVVDTNQLRALVKGRSASEAESALAPFGEAKVELWPAWVTTVTGVDARLSISVVGQDGAAGSGRLGSRSSIAVGRVGRSVSRLLGIDLGERRIGVAVADADGMATPLTTIRRNIDPAVDAAAISRLAAEQGATEIIVGLPFDASGIEGSQATITRAWVEAVRPMLDARVGYRDERLTSHLAEQRLGPMKRGRSGGPPSRTQRDAHRARVDREAAAIILQDELDARASGTTSGDTEAPE